MKLNLSSQIVLNKVPVEFYRPRTAVERSEITRCEKITTDIFPSIDEGAKEIADCIQLEITSKQREGRYCVLALGTGLSLTPVYSELIRKHREEKLSFKNVVVFNAYEYFPLNPESKNSSLNQLKERFLNHVDIDSQNVFSPDGTISQDAVQEYCRSHWKHRDQRTRFGYRFNFPTDVDRCNLTPGNDDELRNSGTGAPVFHHNGSANDTFRSQDIPHGVGRRESRYHPKSRRRSSHRCHSSFVFTNTQQCSGRNRSGSSI